MVQAKGILPRHTLYNLLSFIIHSYRFMCRYQSGFFYRHPLLTEYDYYWRIEPTTKLLCNVPYDPFAKMHANNWKYGFTISIEEFVETVPTLWSAVMQFAENRRQKLPDYDPKLLSFFGNKESYNLCHFWVSQLYQLCLMFYNLRIHHSQTLKLVPLISCGRLNMKNSSII